MATAATIKKNIAKLEAALKSKATPKTLKPKLEAQLVKSKAELSGIKKGTKPKTSSTKSTQTALQKLKEMVNKNKKFKTYKGAGVDLEKDADRPALRTGKRIAKESGKTYYEYRANRIDVKQPPKKYPKLEKGGYMAKGGETGNLEIIDFYVNEYPKDDIAVDINPKATFNGLYQILKNKGDAYKYIGVADSLVRERVFQKLAEIKGVKYDVIYDMWMDSDYAKGGYMAKGGLTEHGLKVGDTIVDNMFWDKSVKVLNSKTGYAVVHLETGERKEMKAMGGEMHRTQDKAYASGGSVDPEKYPELQKIADKISDETAEKINQEVRDVKSNMPYKAQWVLEEVVKDLTNRI
jgi:hypothetical protein